MEKRIELESRRKSPAQVYVLNLDNCRSTGIEGLTADFVNLRTLSLVGVGLTSLKGFPKLASLTKLELSDNRIVGGLQALNDCDRIEVLNLSNNKIKDLTTIEPLKDLKCLKNLDLNHNEITQIDEYRNEVFKVLADLTYLDGFDRNMKEPEESESENEFDEGIAGTNGKAFDESAGASAGSDDLVEEEEDGDEEDAGDEAEAEESEDDEEEDTVGLKDIYREDLDKESDDGDYDEEDDDVTEEDDEDLDDSQDLSAVGSDLAAGESPFRGKKRQHDEDDEDDSANEDGADDDGKEGDDEQQGRVRKRQCEDDEDDSG